MGLGFSRSCWRRPAGKCTFLHSRPKAMPSCPMCADSEDYSSDEERARQRARRAQRKAASKAKAAAKAAAVVPAAGLADNEWDAWASPELEQQLLDEVHTTGGCCGWVLQVEVLGLFVQGASWVGGDAGECNAVPAATAAFVHLATECQPC